MEVPGTQRGAAAVRAALVLASIVAAAPCVPGAPRVEPSRQAAGGEPAELAPWTPVYRDFVDVDALLADWAAARPDEARLILLSRLDDGRPVHALEIHGGGTTPVEERPTVLLLGGLDGISLAGGEAVLCAARALLAQPERRPADVVFVALPWAAPEALEETLRLGWSDGRDRTPLDEDRDGEVDEDGPDDVDGDGVVRAMLVEHAEGPWVRAEDPRFLRRARPGDSPRHVLTREGRDDDGDGRFNEDAAGGLVLDRSFPGGEGGDGSAALGGSLPLSDATARALADLAVARETAVALVFQGDHGGVGVPQALWNALRAGDGEGARLAVDAPAFEAAAARWLAARGAPARARPCPGGSAVEWLYGSLGVLALELAPWGPLPLGGGNADAGGLRLGDLAVRGDPPTASPYEHDPAWARWNDDRRGGLAFREWVPVDLGGGRTALVGGWEPGTRLNPPADELGARAGGGAELLRELAAELPRLALRVVESRREGRVVTLAVRVSNRGALPTGLWPSDRWRGPSGPCGVELALELPPGAEVLAGRERACLGRLLGGQTAGPLEWVLLLEPGDRVALRAEAPWCAPSVLEVQP